MRTALTVTQHFKPLSLERLRILDIAICLVALLMVVML